MAEDTGQRIGKIFENVNSILSEGLDELTTIRMEEYRSLNRLKKENDKLQDQIKEVSEANKKCSSECLAARENLINSTKSGDESLEKGAYFHVETLMRLRGTLEERERSLCLMRDQLSRSIRQKEKMLQRTEVLGTRFRMAIEVIDSGSNVETPEKDGLLAAAVGIAERESAHLARELHDGPAQGFGDIVLVADLVEQYLKNNEQDKMVEELVKLKEIVNDTYIEVRSFLHRLSPPGLEDGLDVALKRLVAHLNSRHGVDIVLKIDGNNKVMPIYMRSNLYKVIYQQLINAIKNGKSSNIKVRISSGSEFFRSVVEDDGSGFDVEEVLLRAKEEGSYGIRNMKDRVELSGGKIKIESTPGIGTCIKVKVPMKINF